MHPRSLSRFTAGAFVTAGISLALWGVLHPWNHITGPVVGASPRWVVAHSFHFLSGLALLGALAGLGMLRGDQASRFGRVAASVWFVGAALWTGTGMITAFVWPTLARHAPLLTEAHGPVFSPPHPVIVVTGLLFSLGMILVGIAAARSGLLSLPAAGCLVLGGVVLLIPPHPLGPAPWPLFVAAAVLGGVGTVSLGLAVGQGGPVATVRAPRPVPAATRTAEPATPARAD